MWLSVLKLLNPAGLIGQVLDNRKHKKDLKHAVQTQRIKNVEAGRVAESEWNVAALKNSGWKDEWFVILLSVPLIGAFIPGMVPDIMAGFTALEGMPVWYQSGIAVAIASSFGLQKYANTSFKNKMNKAYTLPKED